MNYDGLLPYTISAFLGQYQQAIWNDKQDNERVAEEISNVISGQIKPKISIQAETSPPDYLFQKMAAHCNLTEKKHLPYQSLIHVYWMNWKNLGERSNWEIIFMLNATADAKLKRAIVKNGETVTIRASRQTGKSSLLARGIHHAHHYREYCIY